MVRDARRCCATIVVLQSCPADIRREPPQSRKYPEQPPRLSVESELSVRVVPELHQSTLCIGAGEWVPPAAWATGHVHSVRSSVAASRTSIFEGPPAGLSDLRDRLMHLSQLTAHDASMAESAASKLAPRTTCRVRRRPQRRCSKSASQWLRRWSVLLLRVRLLVTLSCLRSFLIVDDIDDPP
jgi:hypothetical protein